MIDRAVQTLRAVCVDVVVVSSLDDTPEGDWTRIPDAREPCGPLGGIEAALCEAEHRGLDGAFVLACDLPLLDADCIRAVVNGLDGERISAPARNEGGRRSGVEPLCAAYACSCLGPTRRLLDEGRRSAHSLFEAVGGVAIELSKTAFLNVNTESDLARAEVELATRRTGPSDD